MKRTKIAVALLLMILLFSSATIYAAAVDPNSPLIPLQMQVLPNGLRVIVKEIPTYPVATINVWVGAGAKDDPAGCSGLAHFFEHLIFKGTATRPPGQIAYEVESLGGLLNAMTSLDFTTYYIVVPAEHAAQAMNIQADALRNSSFAQTEIDQERTVIHEEISLRNDNPQTLLVDMALESLFTGTSYAKPVAGTIDDLANVNRQEMLDFHSRYYVPNNMILVVAGDVDAEDIFAQAVELYGDMEARTLPAEEYITIPRLNSTINLSAERAVQQTYLFFGHPTPGSNTKEAAALTMAGIILGGGRSSRLYQRLIEEEHLVNGISASYSGFSQIGIFGILAALDSANRDRVEEIYISELVRMREELVSEDELERARALVRSDLAFSTESSANVAMFLGQMELFGGVMDAVNRIMVLEQITAQDIQNAMRTYLYPNAYVVSQIRPLGEVIE